MPCAVLAAGPEGPAPSSCTETRTELSLRTTVTAALAPGPACLRTLVSDSCTIRYTVSATPGDRSIGSTSSRVSSPPAFSRYEFAEVRQPGLRTELGRGVWSQDGQNVPHLRECLPARSRDPGQESRYRVRVRAHGTGRRLRLDRDQADRVADDVVQVAGDPQPLLDDRPGGTLAFLGLEPRRPDLEFRDIGAPRADRVPQHPGRRHERGDRQHAPRPGLATCTRRHARHAESDRRDGHDRSVTQRHGQFGALVAVAVYRYGVGRATRTEDR